ncbi:MAG: hypothetical protein WAM24_04120 [Ignavibacteriaceae bacterium]
MKTVRNSKKTTPKMSGVIHIDPEVHKQLKIYCATYGPNLVEFATKELMESLKKKGVKF